MIVLDTDHISFLQWAQSPKARKLGDRLKASREEVVATIVSFEEQMRGWIGALKPTKPLAEQIKVYGRLAAALRQYCTFTILSFDEIVATRFQELRKKHRRLGVMDLKIAAIALTHNAALLSANLRDFRQIAELKVEDWSS